MAIDPKKKQDMNLFYNSIKFNNINCTFIKKITKTQSYYFLY